jgi:hypothetical protein
MEIRIENIENAGQRVPSTEESFETLSERKEVLQGLVDEFRNEIAPVLQEYKNTSGVKHTDEKGYDDNLKRKAFANLITKLGAYEAHVKSIFELFDKKDGGAGLNNLFSLVLRVREQIINAPDIRYDQEAQITTHGGERNIPGNASLHTFEYTQQSIVELESEMRGIETAIAFMNPTKVRNS